MTMDKSVLKTTRHLPWLTLQEMCLLRIVTTLCNNSRLLGLILKCDLETDLRFRSWTRNMYGWEEVEAAAVELVSQLCINALMKRKMMKFLWPVAQRIIRWKSVYAFYIKTKFLRQFYWTDRGRVDNIRTARCLVRNKNICVRKRFTLACCVCIEEEIRVIWKEMPTEDKEYFYATNQEPTRLLVLFWVHLVNGLDDFEKYMFGARECAEELGLSEAVKYLFGISSENKVDMVAHCFSELINDLSWNKYCLEEEEKDLVYSIFFEINEEGQKEIFLNHTLLVLLLLLHSSEYTLCLQLIAERFESVTQFDIIMFLSAVFYTYNLQVVDDEDCGELFMDVWKMIPALLRETIRDTHLDAQFLLVFVRDHFPFLLEEGASVKIADHNSRVLQGKWKFLHFLYEEVTRIPYLIKNKRNCLYFLDPIGPRTMTWENFISSLFIIRHRIA